MWLLSIPPGGHPSLLGRRALGESRLRLLDGYHRPLGHAQRIMVSALLHASSKCLPVKKCSDNVEAIRDTGSRREALVICTRATVGARQRLWVSQVWFLDPGFFVDSGEDTYYKHCGRFTFEKSHVLASRMAFLRTGRPKPGHERRSCHPLCQLLQQLRLLHLQKL